jgi:hypothetical protein
MTEAVAVRAPHPRLPERLRTLAQAVERLAVSGRTDPEQVVIAKMTIARDLRRLAAEVER